MPGMGTYVAVHSFNSSRWVPPATHCNAQALSKCTHACTWHIDFHCCERSARRSLTRTHGTPFATKVPLREVALYLESMAPQNKHTSKLFLTRSDLENVSKWKYKVLAC